jgi:DNA-binding transcriptional ArsR family regulator
MVLDQSANLDRLYRALAHPARRAMLRALAEGERNLSELAAPLAMTFPAATKHVRVLEQASLIHRQKVGRTHICRINAQPMQDAAAWLERYRTFWEGSFDRLDEYLNDIKKEESNDGPTV